MRITPASENPGAWGAVTNPARPVATSSLGAWVALDDFEPAGGVEVRERPDGRAFLSLFGSNVLALRLLVDCARESLARPLYAVCHDDGRDRELLIDLGFEAVLIEDVFRVGFREALSGVSRAWVPTQHSIVPASSVDPRRLFDLDNRLRRMVPGTEDWQGDFEMFVGELSQSPPFEDAGYLVGVDDRSGELFGLIRFWRNRSGPRLGMIGVAPSRRGTTLGPALLAHGLDAASRWGSTHFVTETARTNRHVHRRLLDLGAEITGSFEVLKG